jgi:hypothetical protein
VYILEIGDVGHAPVAELGNAAISLLHEWQCGPLLEAFLAEGLRPREARLGTRCGPKKKRHQPHSGLPPSILVARAGHLQGWCLRASNFVAVLLFWVGIATGAWSLSGDCNWSSAISYKKHTKRV